MFRFGDKEIDAVAKVVRSGRLFRYTERGQCKRFERRYARFLGASHVRLTNSGTVALTAALAGLGIGPGDEVIVPAHTYMATALAVLAVGAIPVIADIDESITLDPKALNDAVGPRTRAVIPVHMWGVVCDMDAIMRTAKKHKILVVEDACQCVGGAYAGRKVGTIGHAGAFSFNYYKNMTCGEGGAVVTTDGQVAKRVECMIDCCGYFWGGREEDFRPFAAGSNRANEFQGAMLNVQLDRLPGMIRVLRRQKKRILRDSAETGLIPAKANSLDHECATHVMFRLPTPEQADRFAALVGGTVAGKTGRHTYTEWDPVLERRGSHHPALDPFRLPRNRRCRMDYGRDVCRRSLEILDRTVLIGLHPDRRAAEVKGLIQKIGAAAGQVL